jgi:hypothetical protein
MRNAGFQIAAAEAFAERHGLASEAAAIRSMPIHDSIVRSAAVRKGCFVKLFEETGHIDQFVAEHWPARYTPGGEQRRMQFLKRVNLNNARLNGQDLAEPPIDDVGEEDLEGTGLFALEAHLRDYIAGNLSKVSVGSGSLSLFMDKAGKSGVEYQTDVGRIDILTTDAAGNYYVFELKVARGPDRALGQLARYMGWVKVHLAAGRNVTGVIVANEIDTRLRYAASVFPSVLLIEYQLDFRIRTVDGFEQPVLVAPPGS